MKSKATVQQQLLRISRCHHHREIMRSLTQQLVTSGRTTASMSAHGPLPRKPRKEELADFFEVVNEPISCTLKDLLKCMNFCLPDIWDLQLLAKRPASPVE